jgi:hypothetical protein
MALGADADEGRSERAPSAAAAANRRRGRAGAAWEGGRARAIEGGGRGAPRRRPRTSSFVSSGASPRRPGRRRPRPRREGTPPPPHRPRASPPSSRNRRAERPRWGARSEALARALAPWNRAPETRAPECANASVRSGTGARVSRVKARGGARIHRESSRGAKAWARGGRSALPSWPASWDGTGEEKNRNVEPPRHACRIRWPESRKKEKVHEWALGGTPSSLKKEPKT